MTLFTGVVADPEKEYQVGWYAIGYLVLQFTINYILIFLVNYKSIRPFVIKYYRRNPINIYQVKTEQKKKYIARMAVEKDLAKKITKER